MWTTYINTIRAVLRTPGAVIWTLIFPIVLTTVFNYMFTPLRAGDGVEAVPVAIVTDDAWWANSFSDVIEQMETDTDRILDVHAVESVDEAENLLTTGTVDGIYRIDASGDPLVTLAPETSPSHAGSNFSYEINRSILENIATRYLQNQELVTTTIEKRPELLAVLASNAEAQDQAVTVEEISLTRSRPDAAIRFYYALLGMVSLFAAQAACLMVATLQPTTSSVAARRCVSGMGRVRQLVPTVLGCWTASTLLLSGGLHLYGLNDRYRFLRQSGLCFAGVAVAAFLATSLGALVGALPIKSSIAVRDGLLTALTCLLSLFAGLYGKQAMEFSDMIARAFPATVWANPVSLVRDIFYSLYYYDSLAPFAMRAAVCMGAAMILLLITIVMLRRQRYEHL